MDSSFSIIIDENDVTNIIEDVPIEEIRYIEGTSLKLTKEQIIIELSNLLYEFYKNNVQRKVDLYSNIFKSIQSHKKISSINNIIPVIECTKIQYYDNDEFVVDPTNEAEYNIKFEKFQSFLNQFNKLFKSQEGYHSVLASLGKLFTPFQINKTNNSTTILNNTDAIRIVGLNHQQDQQPIRLLQDDVVQHHSYFNKVDDKLQYITFDWVIYLEELRKISANDNVEIYFNDFYFHNNQQLTYLKGTVFRIMNNNIYVKPIDKSMEVFKYNIKDLSTSYFIYDENSTNKYHKLLLKNNNIHFLNVTEDILNKYILPSTFTEIFYLSNKNLSNFNDIKQLLNDLNLNINDLDKSAQDILKSLLIKKYPPLKISKNPEFLSSNTFTNIVDVNIPFIRDIKDKFVDSDVTRYRILHKSLYTEYSHILKLISSFMEKKHKNIDIDLLINLKEKLGKQLYTNKYNNEKDNCSSNNNQFKLTKVYDTIEKLKKDNGKVIYYDRQLDPTDYKLNLQYDNDHGLRNELISRKVKVSDLDFEVKTIRKGKRKVREGDNSVLIGVNEDIVYVRRRINDEMVWIKQTKLPFKFCMDSIHEDILNEELCSYDTYDNVCKTVKNVKETMKYNDTKQKLESIDAIIEFNKNFDKFLQCVKDDEDFYSNLLKLSDSNNDQITLTELPSIDLDEFDGELFDEMSMIQDFNDASHYDVLPVDKKQDNIDISGPSSSFVLMISNFMELNMDHSDIKYIVDYVNDNIKDFNINDKIQNERNKLNKSINKNLYNSNDEYRQKVDTLVKSKIAAIEQKTLSEMYYDIAIHTIALLSLLIMAKYPDLLINNIYPSCIRFMSYLGYPLNEKNSTRSISKYIACLVKGITSGDDVKFSKIQSTSIDDLNSSILSIVDDIIKDDVNLRLRVDANKSIIINKKLREDSFNLSSMYGFKPSFNFEKPTSKISSYLEYLNTIVSDTKHLKLDISNAPTLFNACCLEQLADDTSYYKFFYNTSEYKTLRKTIKETIKRPNNIVLPPLNIKTTTTVNQGEIRFNKAPTVDTSKSYIETLSNSEKIERYITSNKLLLNDAIFQGDIKDFYMNEKSWDEIVYPLVLKYFDAISDIIKQNIDNYDSEKFEVFKNTLILLRNIRNSKLIRNVLVNYIRSKLPRIISRVIHGIHSNSKYVNIEREINLYESFNNNKDYDKQIFQYLSDNLLLSKDLLNLTNDDIININFINYVMMKLFYNMITLSINNKTYNTLDNTLLLTHQLSVNDLKKNNLKLTCDLISFMIEQLVDSLILNDVNTESINKNVENLRELKKQDLMNKYHIDDEKRQLQMTLRALGMDTWYDVGDSEKDQYIDMLDNQQIDISKYQNKRQEDENYEMKDYKGENQDEDETD
jgi:hypothetical protein